MTLDQKDLPLAGMTVVDFSQFLSGPAATLRLADLGARVIKVERPDGGDLCRQLYLSDTDIGGDSTLFHAINRNKESFAANLKDPADVRAIWRLIEDADIFVQNFRPGVIDRLGLGYEDVSKVNPGIVYGSITGFGDEGPWKDRPGQDLLAQSRSGLVWLSGDRDDPPVPVGLAIADMLAGYGLVQGILAALVRRGRTGRGGLIETSLLEVLLDFQFEVLTTHLNDGLRPPVRAAVNNAHAYLSAPYGIYATADGYLSIAMMPVPRLAELIGLDALKDKTDPKSWFTERDTIKAAIADHLRTRTTEHWLSILEPADVWCAEVLDWRGLMASDGFKVLDFLQTITGGDADALATTSCPLRIDGQRPKSPRAAPRVGEHTQSIRAELGLDG